MPAWAGLAPRALLSGRVLTPFAFNPCEQAGLRLCPAGPAEMCPHSHPAAGCLLPSLPARSPLPTLQALCRAGSLITGLI